MFSDAEISGTMIPHDVKQALQTKAPKPVTSQAIHPTPVPSL